MKKMVLLFLCLGSGLVIFTNCSSLRGIPEWVESYPAEEGYFIGIGSSNTGNRGEDMELARARALASLAASISTTIRSEQTFTTFDTSAGDSVDSAEIIIRETVDQNLEAVEVYDSFHSESEGYWFYLRIHKGRWAAIQREDMDKVIRRAYSVLEPYLPLSKGTIAQKLTSLGAGWEIVSTSPYAGLLETALEGRQVILIDYIENRIGTILQEVTINSQEDEIAVDTGSALPIAFSVSSGSGIIPGRLPVRITQKTAQGPPPEPVTGSFITASDGSYAGELDTKLLAPGEYSFTISLDMEGLGIRAASFRNKPISPAGDIRIDVQNLTALLITRVPADSGVFGIDESVKSLLTERLPFDLTLDRDVSTGSIIEFSLVFRDVPENDFGLFMSYCKAVISFIRNGSTIYSYETEEFKDGGLDFDQAHQRAAGALFRFLKEDEAFAVRINEALQH